MTNEFNALLKNNTWVLVPPPPNQHVVGCKWVFKLKHKVDGSIKCYKAHLVAKGFHQQAGVDFDETFSPIIKSATIRTIPNLTASYGWSMHQLDVRNAFFHGDLVETAYTVQLLGFIDHTHPTHVCHLHNAIYGLKQAPRAWFQRLSSLLLQFGYK